MQLHTVSDLELWRACQRDDPEALGGLFERHHAQAYRYCLRRVFTAEDAEDCLSETFMEVWRSRRSFEVTTSGLPVILAVAKRVTQKHQRAGGRRRRSLVRQAGLRMDDEMDVADAVTQSAHEADRLRWLAHEVGQLAPPDRDVYDLVMYAELSQDAAAAILDIPIGTVKSRLHRARRLISDSARRDLLLSEESR